MEWDSGWNIAIAWIIVLALVPWCQKNHRKAHEEAKRRMPDGWLKWLVTHEFCKRSAKVP